MGRCAEVAAYYIPWTDNALDLICTPLALVGGVLMTGGVLGDVPHSIASAIKYID